MVRTNTPFKGFIAATSMLPLFAPPLVAGVAWTILGSPKTGLINTMFKWMHLDLHVNFYSLWGLVFVFGIYYAPYVYMFTSSALRNMDPSLEEAAEISGASAFATLFSVTFPLIMPAALVGAVLAFIGSWDEVIVAGFMTSPTFRTVPILIYGNVQNGAQPDTSAVGTMVTVVSLLLLGTVAAVPALRGRRIRRRTA